MSFCHSHGGDLGGDAGLRGRCSFFLSYRSIVLVISDSQLFNCLFGLTFDFSQPFVQFIARMLHLVGLGLADETDITVRGLEIVKRAERVYLEAYTAILLVDKAKLVSGHIS